MLVVFFLIKLLRVLTPLTCKVFLRIGRGHFTFSLLKIVVKLIAGTFLGTQRGSEGFGWAGTLWAG